MGLSQDAFCGFTDWAVNKPKELTGLTCGTLQYPSAGSMLYTLYKIEHDRLCLGTHSATNDGSTEAKRSVAIDGSNCYFRK